MKNFKRTRGGEVECTQKVFICHTDITDNTDKPPPNLPLKGRPEELFKEFRSSGVTGVQTILFLKRWLGRGLYLINI